MNEYSVLAIIGLAKRNAVLPQTPTEFLQAFSDKLALQILAGRTVVSSSEAGGSTTFASLDGAPIQTVLEVIARAIEHLDAGTTPRPIKRLQVSFSQASPC